MDAEIGMRTDNEMHLIEEVGDLNVRISEAEVPLSPPRATTTR